MAYGPFNAGSGAGTAAHISYDNTTSTLEAGNVQEAVDAVNAALDSKLDSENPVMNGEIKVVNGSNGSSLVTIDKSGHTNFTNSVVIGGTKTINGSVLSVGENPGLQYCSRNLVVGNGNQSYWGHDNIMVGDGNYSDGNGLIMVGSSNVAGMECDSIVVGQNNLLSANEELFKVVSYTTTTLVIDPTFNKDGIRNLSNSSNFGEPCIMTGIGRAALPFYIKSYNASTKTITFKKEIPDINSYAPEYFIAMGRYERAQSEGAVFGYFNTLCGSSYIMGKFNNVCGYANFVTGFHNSISESTSGGSRHSFISGEYNKNVADIRNSSAIGNNLILPSYQHVFGHYNKSVSDGSNFGTYGSALLIGNGINDNSRSNCFRVQYNGSVYSQGAYNTSGADYAELFEWEDGNPNNEDRRGRFVALSGRKIHIAKPGEIPIGVISSTAAIIGNNHSETWQGMYLKDIWGDVLTEYKEISAETETIQHPAKTALDENGNEVIVSKAWEETRIIKPEFKGMVPVVNPDYNPDDTYIPRHERKEWGIVGLYGQLIVIDDGTCQVNSYCTCTENGTATSSENGYLVIERLDDTHIRILSNFLNTQQQVDTLKEETLSTMEAVTQVYEQGIESDQTTVTSMEAITQNYELILELQATIQKLQEEIQTLKEAK